MSSSSRFACLMMYSLYRLIKYEERTHPCLTPFPIEKLSESPYYVRTFASWFAYSDLYLPVQYVLVYPFLPSYSTTLGGQRSQMLCYLRVDPYLWTELALVLGGSVCRRRHPRKARSLNVTCIPAIIITRRVPV